MENAAKIGGPGVALFERKHTILSELEKHPFRPPRWLRNAHAQTLYAALVRLRDRVPLRRERWTTPDGDFLDVHVCDGVADHPTVLVLHGLEGSVRSKYVCGLMATLRSAGWSSICMEFRSCGREMNRARRMYHSGETADLAFVAGRLIETCERLYIAGFSLGGNVLAKWLGELGEEVPDRVRAAAVISAPFDLTVSGPHIDRVAGGFYSRHFLRSLIKKAIMKEMQHPGCVDIARVRRSRTLYEFDTHATARLHGFRDADHYWDTQRCCLYLPRIRIPTLLVSSSDDPFNPGSTLPREIAERSPYLCPMFTEAGGHVGFVQGPMPLRTRYWAEEQTLRFFQACDALDTEREG